MDRIHDILNSINQTLVNAAQKTHKDQLGIKRKAEDEDFTKIEEKEEESPEMEMMEYKNDFYQMSIGSLKAIMQHSQAIIAALDNPNIRENLTESWLQGKIAITEDYMRTIHDFVMFVSEGKIKADTYNDINQFELGPSTMKNLDDLYGDDEANDPLNNTNAALDALKKAHSCATTMIDKVTEPMVTERLTSAWNDGKIDAACKSMGQLHDFVMNVPLADDDKTMVASEEMNEDQEESDLPIDTKSGNKPGLWDNIRKKKERMGKEYKPAKPGDKDRPDPEQWKKLTK